MIYRVTHGYRLAQAQLPRPRRALPPAMTQTRQPAPRLTVSGATARLDALGQEFLLTNAEACLVMDGDVLRTGHGRARLRHDLHPRPGQADRLPG